MKIRVLLVHNRYRQRAGEDRSFDAERELLARDDRIDLCEHVVDSREVDDYGLVAKAAIPLRMSWSRRAAAAIAALLSEQPRDVVHFHNTFPLISPSAYRECRRRGIAVVQSVRNFRQFCANGVFFRDGHVCEDCVGRAPQWPGAVHRCYQGSAIRSAAVVAMQTIHSIRGTWRDEVDRYVVPTRFVRDKLAAVGLPGQKIVVKPDVVSRPNVPSDAPRAHAVFVGRLTYEKGIFTLLRAWRGLPDIPLLVAGGGGEDERARAEAARLGLGQRVTFLGETPHGAAVDAIARARFVVIPSLSYETFGRTAVEAYACGTPVLASRTGALAETVVEGETGFLFEPGDADALAAAARRLWTDASALEPRARARYEETYEPAVVNEQLVQIYSDVTR